MLMIRSYFCLNAFKASDYLETDMSSYRNREVGSLSFKMSLSFFFLGNSSVVTECLEIRKGLVKMY